jgi:heme/copper-type cytochrome/quinol oxidase subunit 2
VAPVPNGQDGWWDVRWSAYQPEREENMVPYCKSGLRASVLRSALLTTAAVLLLAALTIWTVAGLEAFLSVSPTAGSDGVKDISIRARSWGFTPRVIRVEPGDTVRFRVVSDDIKHGFAINELGLNLQLASGREVRSADVKVALPPGKYPIHCSTFCGLGHSTMKASLVVGDPGPTAGARFPWLASLLALAAAGSFAVLAARRRPPGP